MPNLWIQLRRSGRLKKDCLGNKRRLRRSQVPQRVMVIPLEPVQRCK